MMEKWRKYLGATVPRYTSYPSALYFGDEVSEADRNTSLGRIGHYDPISLYVHVPYCASLCWYCGCNMKVENRYSRVEGFLEAITTEIRQVARHLNGHGRVSQVHFGGGTPNFLRPDDLHTILDAIEGGFGLTDGTPIAIEMDPRLMNPEQIKAMGGLGVKRVSLGVQDFDPFVQTAIHRIQSFELIDACVSQLREVGIEDISLDLLYGLPRQTLLTFKETIRKTISLSPERISLFGYAHAPSKFKHQKLINDDELPSPEDRAALISLAMDEFMAAGYVPIGFDHFARPSVAIAQAQATGRLNRNFQGFTEDPSHTVIGFGPSAISSFEDLYVQNTKDPKAYAEDIIDQGHACSRGLKISQRDQFIGEWIRRFLCDGAGDLDVYAAGLGLIPQERDDILRRLAPLVEDGLVSVSGHTVAMEPSGRVFSRSVAAIFDPYVQKQSQFASQAV